MVISHIKNLKRNLHPNIKKAAPDLVKKLNNVLKDQLVSLVVFGSATRIEDFVDGISDIDVCTIVKTKSKKVEEKIRNVFLEIEKKFDLWYLENFVKTEKEIKDGYSSGCPLSAYLVKDSFVLCENNFIRNLGQKEFILNKNTIHILIYSSFGALNLGFNDWIHAMPQLCLNYAYHAIRNSARALSVHELKKLPLSNMDILKTLKKISKSKKTEFFNILKLRNKYSELLENIKERFINFLEFKTSDLLTEKNEFLISLFNAERFCREVYNEIYKTEIPNLTLTLKKANSRSNLVALNFNFMKNLWAVITKKDLKKR